MYKHNGDLKKVVNEEQMSQEDIQAQLMSEVNSKPVNELIDYLDRLTPNEAFIVIRDYIKLAKMKEIRNLKETDKELYQRFQDIKRISKEHYDYDNKVALMKDVNRAATNVYGLLLKMISTNRDDNDKIIAMIQQAINHIEDKLDLPMTQWVMEETPKLESDKSEHDESTDDNGGNEDANLENEQGIS